MRSILIALCLVSSSFAQPLPWKIQLYMEDHSRVWNQGKVCRHASSSVAEMASRRGDFARIPMFKTEDPNEDHVLVVVKHKGKWYAIDSIREGDQYFPTFRVFNDYDPARDLDEYADFSSRNLTEYVGDASYSTIDCWLDEEECKKTQVLRISAAMDEISKLKKFVSVGEEAIKIFTKQFPNLWRHYQDRVSELEIQNSME